MKNFKSFIQLDEVERVKYKDGIANKMAYASDEVKTKGNRLDNKQPFGEGDAYDKDVKASPKPHDKEAAAARAKLAALAARKAMMTNKMSEAETHQAKTTMKHINNPNAAEKKAAKDIEPGIKGVRSRLAMLQAAKDRGALKEDELDELSKSTLSSYLDKKKSEYMKGKTQSGSKENAKDIQNMGKAHDKMNKEDIDAEILFDLYNKLDESNQEIFLNQLEEDAEVLLAFAKTIAEE